MSFVAAGDRWRFVVTWMTHVQDAEQELTVYRNNRRVKYYTAKDLDGAGLEVKRLVVGGDTVIGVLAIPPAGHAVAKHFFTVRKRSLVHMGRVGGENGGPWLRDEDGDGRPEWVFDNYNWYEQYDAGPTQYVVYKLSRAGTLRPLKRRRNSTRRRLPDPFGFECC